MKLITELVEDVQYIQEAAEGGGKDYYIEGVFLQGEVKNRNGRVYPTPTLMNECRRYIREYVNKGRALGELNHPTGPTVNLDRVSHMVKSLNESGRDIVGRAKVMNTPMGNIVKNLINEGAKLGVSSRGMGSLKPRNGYQEVQEDFMLAAIDIVADPSAPNAFVNGIMEGKEWVWDNGLLKAEVVENYHRTIQKSSSRNLERNMITVFKHFLKSI
jgi:Prohead core protein serine protease